MDRTRRTFLNEGQIQMLQKGRLAQWPNESIMKGLKFRFALSVPGYKYLRSTGYPLPSYSTLMRRIQDFKLEFGIFKDVLELLRVKVETMDRTDKFCILSYDEMQIKEQLDYDKSIGKYTGFATLGDQLDKYGEKIFAVVARGVKSHWKQIIACHVTRKESIDTKIMKAFMFDCIESVEKCGLYVLALSSDMDGRNRSLWRSLGILASRNGVRRNSFVFNGHEIFTTPDACHLLKNLKSAMLRQLIYLPADYVEQEQLPITTVAGCYIVQLWHQEIANNSEKRLLHHLRREDIEPSNFEKMNVGAAVRFFTPKTYSAIITAIENNLLPREALTTAHFILVVHEWFTLLSSKVRKTSITLRNCDRKYIFLHTIIDLFQNTIFEKDWKPLNYGFVLATLTFADAAEFLLKSGFDFVSGHRFTQDVTENIFSTVKRKEGSVPTAQKALRAIRSISVSQFISDTKRSSYMNDSDEFLLDFCKDKKKSNLQTSSTNTANETPAVSAACTTSAVSEFKMNNFSFDDFSQIMDQYDSNSTFYIAGSTTRAVVKHVCPKCVEFMCNANLPSIEFINKAKTYTKSANRGGLKEPCSETFSLILHCEYYFNLYKSYLLKNGNFGLIRCLVDNVNTVMPICCNLKEKIIKHYFNVRSYCVKNFSENCKQRKEIYGTASAKRKK